MGKGSGGNVGICCGVDGIGGADGVGNCVGTGGADGVGEREGTGGADGGVDGGEGSGGDGGEGSGGDDAGTSCKMDIE